MRRAIQRLVQDPLALRLLTGEFRGRYHVVRRTATVQAEFEAGTLRSEPKLSPVVAGHAAKERDMNSLKTVLLLGLLSGLLLVGGERHRGPPGHVLRPRHSPS